MGIYAGRTTNITATTSVLPSGWTVVKNSTGNYTVTHSLGSALYTLVVSHYAGIPLVAVGHNILANTFSVLSWNTTTDVAADSIFHFTLTVD